MPAVFKKVGSTNRITYFSHLHESFIHVWAVLIGWRETGVEGDWLAVERPQVDENTGTGLAESRHGDKPYSLATRTCAERKSSIL